MPLINKYAEKIIGQALSIIGILFGFFSLYYFQYIFHHSPKLPNAVLNKKIKLELRGEIVYITPQENFIVKSAISIFILAIALAFLIELYNKFSDQRTLKRKEKD